MPTSYEFTPAQAAFIVDHARGRALELGTGSARGTHALLAAGCDPIHTLDELKEWQLAADARIKRPGFSATHNPLKTKGSDKWYDFEPVGLYDTVIIDGPKTAAYRKFAMEVIANSLPLTDWTIIYRAEAKDHGVATVQEWLRVFPIIAVPTHGMWLIMQSLPEWKPDEWDPHNPKSDNDITP